MARNGEQFLNPATGQTVKVVGSYVGASSPMVEYLTNGTIFTSAADSFFGLFVKVA